MKTFVALFLSFVFFAASALGQQNLDYTPEYTFSTEIVEGAYTNGLGNLNWNLGAGEGGAELDLNSQFQISTSFDHVDQAFPTSLPDAAQITGFGITGTRVSSLYGPRTSFYGNSDQVKPLWQTATGKFPVFPSIETESAYKELSNLAKNDLLRGTLYSSDKNGRKSVTSEGKKFKERFCSQLKNKAMEDPVEFMTLSFLPDTPDTTKRASEVHLTGGGFLVDQDSLYRISAAAKDFYNKLCERKTAGECSVAVKENPETMDRVCDEVFQTHFLAPHMDLQTTYLSSIFNNHTTLASQKDRDEFLSQASCGEGKNCFFMPSAGSPSCDPFNCSMADQESLNTESLEWSKAFLLGSPDYRFASSDSRLCDKCFREQFSVLSERGEAPNSTFDQSKARAEKELIDRLAANAAGKALLEFSAGLETAFDLSKLYPQTFEGLLAQNFCAVDFSEKFSKLSSEGCGNGTGKEDVKKRLSMAAQSLGIEKEVFLEAGGIVKGLAQKINPSREDNSCQREDFVKSAKLQWNSIGNQEYVEAFRDALNETSSNQIIGHYCENKNLRPSKRNVTDVYSETAAQEYWLEKGEKVYRMISEGGKVRDILLTEHCPITTEGNAAEKAICGKGGAAFQGLANAENGRLQMLLDQKPNISKKEFERLFKRSLQLRLKAALEVPMKLDPGIRLVLNDWDLYCKARNEYEKKDFSLLRHLRGNSGGFELHNPDTVLQLHDFVESIAINKREFREKINIFRNNLCGQAAQKMENAVCRGGDNPDLERELSRYSPEDIKKAQSQLERERGLKDQLVINSLSCSLKTMEREKPELFSPTDTTLASALGVPSNFEENLAVEERKNGFGKNTATQWGMNFNTWEQCTEATKEFTDRALGSTGGSEVKVEERYDPDRYLRHHREVGAQYANVSEKPPVIAGGSGGGSGSLKGGEGFSVAAFFGFGDDSDSNKTLERKAPLSSDVEFAQEENASISSPMNDTREFNVKNDNDQLFDQEDEPGQGWSPFPNAHAAARAPASINPSGINPFYEPVVDTQASVVDEDNLAIAEKAGIEDLNNSNEKFKQAFEDVLDRKLSRQDLDQLRAENDKLKREMEKIKGELDAESKPVRVLDSSGADRTNMVANPAASAKVVLNPRNQAINEFRSRAYFEGRKSEYSPNFSSTYQPERVSLRDYSSQRRAVASRTPVSEVKDFNAKLDESFLQRTASRTVDDSYIERYVEHVNQNSGSIEHLVVFENGVPARIRVPDPRNPGDYVERPLRGELAQRVLKEVEGDEVSSYAIYNMVSFGESLQDFMASLEKEESNLAALDVLNQRLEEAKSLE